MLGQDAVLVKAIDQEQATWAQVRMEVASWMMNAVHSSRAAVKAQ